MAQNGTVLSAKQQRAIEALLSSKSVAEAAASAKVAKRTLFRWMAEDQAFRAALSQAEGEMLDAATRRLLNLQGESIDTLEYLISQAQTESVRLRAAQVVIETSLKLRELRDIEQRLTALEQAQAG